MNSYHVWEAILLAQIVFWPLVLIVLYCMIFPKGSR